MRSVRQSLASSTAERSRLPRYCSSFASNRENSAKESAAEPAKPARTLSLYSLRIFFADCLTTVSPKVTWPSLAMTVCVAVTDGKDGRRMKIRTNHWFGVYRMAGGQQRGAAGEADVAGRSAVRVAGRIGLRM